MKYLITPMKRPSSNEQVDLGTYLHTADDTPVLKLTCTNIPYPNSFVLFNNRVVGKVDEVLGTLDGGYCSVTLDRSESFTAGCVLQAYRDKFIFKNKLLPRTEVEKKKESGDVKRATSFKKEGGERQRRPENKRGYGGDKSHKRIKR